MSLIDRLKEESKKNKKSVILADGEDVRTAKAAANICSNGYANVSVIGNYDEFMKLYEKENPTENVEVIDLENDSRVEEFATYYFNKRKGKETMESSLQAMKRPCYYAATAVDKGVYNGAVAGNVSSSAEVLRGALRGIGMKDGIKSVSSFMILETPINEYGDNGTIFFSDIAIIPNPSSEQLAEIAEVTAISWRQIMSTDPKVALLSYSTLGSSEGDSVTKVREALELIKNKNSSILVDGEMQFDAALIPTVGKRKAPESKVAGEANIFIFPSLDAGNIGYKIAERLCVGATATGPIIQGLKKPMNDLSRGCSWEDIVNTSLVTLFQSENK